MLMLIPGHALFLLQEVILSGILRKESSLKNNKKAILMFNERHPQT